MSANVIRTLSVIAFLPWTALHAQDDDPNAAKLEKLEASAVSFVDAYNKGDAAALAKLFLPDGEITLADGGVVSGRDEIEEFYAEIFSPEETPQAALEAGSVRFVTPAIAIEEGTFHVTAPDGEVISHNYTAVQVQQDDGSWLTASVRDSLEDTAPPSEKMLGLEWIVGDWKIQAGGSTTWITFDWSDDGPFIDGRALTEEAGEESTSATWRIAWDPKRKGYTSWGFDALGGFTKSEWTEVDEASWMLRTRGVTADGESNVSTQTLVLDPSSEHFAWTTRDQLLGGEAQPERTVRVVRRPPEPKSAATE
ncbi:SnoaL-like domain protein [Haloferula helveola]|uniref:SnoaL-like domain protein n=1 Tax=Haloferula helveola TaxID=490095 RepID=A0ABM7RI96_9BACT|nr:SnoaL-like domain protein [Haloferula helveola]